MEFIHDDFLLHSETARQLYHNYAAGEPVLDYHSHLSPADIATDRRFRDLSEMWLEGDHYKWRAMRANGIDERYCTGTAARYEKFLAWARTVPATLRNPLYHWTHLELKRYFGVNELLDERSAKNIWDKANALLATPELSVRNILRKFRVLALCTTDDPCDDLAHHQKIAADRPGFRVYPTFRPDQALQVYAPGKFNSWVERLAAASNRAILKFSDFLEALQERHDYFHANGGRISDHGLARCPADWCTESEAAAIFDSARAGTPATPEDQVRFASFLMVFFGRLDAEKGWTKQLHLGALRNANTRLVRALGPDTGFDSIGDWNQAEALCALSRSTGPGARVAKDHRLQCESRGQLCSRHSRREFSGRIGCGKSSIWQRVVVSGSEGSNGVATERAFEHRSTFAVRRNAHGFPFVHVVPPARIFSACSVRHAGPRRGTWRDSQ